MNTLAQQLEAQLREELNRWRRVLQLDAPITQAAAPEAPAIFRGPDGEWLPIHSLDQKRPRVRPATYGETIDMIEAHASQYARIEAATIEHLSTVLIVDEPTRLETLERLVPCWPWTAVDHSDTPVLMARAEINARIAAPDGEARDGAAPELRWPDAVDLTDVVSWVAEGLERGSSGAGESYRNSCAAGATSSSRKKASGQEGLRSHFKVEATRQLIRERPDAPLALEVLLPLELLGSTDKVLSKLSFSRLVAGEQLAWLFWALPETVKTARSVRRVLAHAASGDAQKHLLNIIAPRAISEEKAEPNDAAIGDLAEAVRQSIKSFGDAGHARTLPTASDEADRLASELDRAFAGHLESLGERGKTIAANVLDKSNSRAPGEQWRLWQREPDGERFLVLLARALWSDVVGPRQALIGTRRPAIVRAIAADRLLPAMTRQMGFPELDDGTVRDDKGRVLGRIALTTDATLEAVRRGAYALGTVAGNRLIRSLIHRSHDSWNRGEQNPSRVAYEGGWLGLLDQIGVSHKYQQQLKEIAKAGQCIEWETPHATFGGLWLWSDRRGTKIARGEVAFVLGDALAPGYGDELARTGGNSLSARVARRLVPELRHEPPMGGARENEHGAIWTLHRLMLVELVDHAEDLHAQGGVVIPTARWRELARTAGVAPSIIDRTLDAWVSGDTKNENAPPLLERLERDAWTLAKPHEPEREFIAAGGAKRTKGRAAAQKASERVPRGRKRMD